LVDASHGSMQLNSKTNVSVIPVGITEKEPLVNQPFFALRTRKA